jgi:hypothetical protein
MLIPWLFIGKTVLNMIKRRMKGPWKKQALALVKKAAVLFANNDERRRYVQAQLIEEFGLSESMSRRVVEWGVNRWKSRG